MNNDDDNNSEGSNLPPIPGSPTPIRVNGRKVYLDSSNNELGPPPARRPISNTSSPTSSPNKRSRMVYGDRYIPNRNGINLQAAFSLAGEESSDKKTRRPATNELDFQRVEEANRTFSTLLKAELFGNDVPSAIPSSVSSNRTPGSNSRQNNTTDDNGIINKSPPQMSTRSEPVTPNKNMFHYKSPSRNARDKGINTTGGVHKPLFSKFITSSPSRIANSSHEIYSVSPVRMDSQRLLLSPKKQPRPVSKVPYKVLDAPDLADDFYLNLVDWGSNNLLGVGLGRSVYLWNAQTGEVDSLCTLNEDRITSISWINRGPHLAIGTDSGTVQIWDSVSFRRIRKMTGHTARAGSLAWNEHILTSGSLDRTILHRDVRVADHYITRLTGHRQEVCGLRWNTEENQLASGGNDNKLIVWDGLNTDPLYKFNEHEAAVKAISWSPHQRGLLASGGGTADRKIRFWNTLNGTLLDEIDTGSQVCNLAWSKNSNEIVSTHGYSQHQIMIWKYPSLQQVAALTGHTYRVLYLAMSPDGKTIVTGAGDETLRFWNVFDENRVNSRPSSSLLDVFQQLR